MGFSLQMAMPSFVCALAWQDLYSIFQKRPNAINVHYNPYNRMLVVEVMAVLGLNRDRRKKGILYVLAMTAGGILILYLLISDIQVEQTVLMLSTVSLDTLLILLLLLLVSNILRAQRLRCVYGARGLSFFFSLSIVFMSNFLSSLLPARLGDFSYPWFLKQGLQVRYSDGVSTLVLLRLFDLLSLGILFALSLAAMPLGSRLQVDLWMLAVLLLAGATLLVGIALYAPRRIRLPIEASETQKKGLKTRGLILLRKVLVALRRTESTSTVVSIGLTSLGVWLSNYFFGLVFVHRLSIVQELGKAFFALNLSNLASILPVQSIAGLGTFEGVWTAAFTLIGVPRQEAFLSGLLLHIIRFTYSFGLALLGLVFFFAHNRVYSKPNTLPKQVMEE